MFDRTLTIITTQVSYEKVETKFDRCISYLSNLDLVETRFFLTAVPYFKCEENELGTSRDDFQQLQNVIHRWG